MLPLKDNVPTRSFPVVTSALIVANVLVWVWEIPAAGLERDVVRYGYYPCALDAPCVGAAVRHHQLVVESVVHLDVHARRLGAHRSATCSSSGSSATTSRTRSAACGSSSGTCSAGIAATASQTFVTLHFGSAADASVPNVGASGAIAGVLGAYFVLLPRAQRADGDLPRFFFIFREMPAVFFLGVWFALQLLARRRSRSTHPASGGGVAFFAHIGGFVVRRPHRACCSGSAAPCRPSCREPVTVRASTCGARSTSCRPSSRAALENVAVVVEDENPRGSRPASALFRGASRTCRPKITIYRLPLEEDFPDPAELEREIRITVLHELAHYFGIDEDRLDELGYE